MPTAIVGGQDNLDGLRMLEEARKEAKRAEIRKQIGDLETKIPEANIRRSDLAYHQSMLDTYLEDWNTHRQLFSAIDISEVVIVNVFEGVCAEKIKSDLETCILQMDQTCEKVRGLKDNIGKQILKLDEYVLNIDGMIKKLKDNLDSI